MRVGQYGKIPSENTLECDKCKQSTEMLFEAEIATPQGPAKSVFKQYCESCYNEYRRTGK